MGTLNFIEKNGICLQNSSMSANKRVTFYANANRQGRLVGSVLLANFSKCVLFFLCVMACSCVTPKKFKAYQKNQDGITAKLEARIVELEKENITLSATNYSQDVTIASLQNSMTSLETKLSNTENKLQNVQTILNNLADNITKCQKEVSGMEPRIKSLEEYRQKQCVVTEYDDTAQYCSDGCEISEQLNNSNQEEEEPDFSLVDNYVLNISYDDTNPDNYKYLVDLITRNANTKYEKARAIFMWIANNISYDVTYTIYDANRTFSYRRGVCAGYSDLYNKFCKLAGLEVQTIIGVAKDISYKKGDDLEEKRHAWNAVKDDEGRWILVDATWGAGYVNNGVFTRKVKPYWFDSDPSLFVLTHLPENSNWQLIEKTITRADFEDLSPIYPDLALMGINGKALLNRIRTYGNNSLPVINTFNDVKVNQVPLSATLSSSQVYSFSFTASEEYKIAIYHRNYEDDYYNYKKEIYFNKKGKLQTIEYKPTKGYITVYCEHTGGAFPLLKYEVE